MGGQMPKGDKGPKQAKSKKELKRTTTKKERQAAKAAKKAEQTKTRTEREAEVQDIKDRLADYGVTIQYPAVLQLYVAMDDYVETGQAACGSIFFPEAPPQPQGRNIVYKLPTRRGNRCTCDLIVREGSQFLDPDALDPQGSQSPEVQGSNGHEPVFPELPELSPSSLAATQAQVHNPLGNYAESLAQEIERINADRKAHHEPEMTAEEARKLATRLVPSAEDIQEMLDSTYLPKSQSELPPAAEAGEVVRSSSPAVVEIVEEAE